MEEVSPFKGQRPESSSDDDDDDDIEVAERKEKRTTKIPRHMPLGVEVATDEEKENPVRKLSLSERFLQQLEIRTPKKEELEETKTPVWGEAVRETAEDDVEGDKQEAAEVTHISAGEDTDNAITPTGEAAPEQPATTPAELSVADWEPEGEITATGEAPRTEGHEVFAEVPIANTESEETAEPVEDELLETGLGSERMPTEPEEAAHETPAAEAEPDEPDASTHSRTAASTSGAGGGGGGYAWYDAAAAEHSARETVRSVSDPDAEYYAEKRGIRKGLLAGGVFGWMLGRRGKKKAAAAHKKEMTVKEKEITSLKQEQVAAQERLEAVRRTQAQLESQIAQEAARPPVRQEAQPVAAKAETVKPVDAIKRVMEKPYEARTAAILAGTELAPRQRSEMLTQVQNERGQAESVVIAAAEALVAASVLSNPELTASTSSESRSAESRKNLQELPPEDRPITEETYEAPEGRRVEASAWHRIEIDQKTGKVVNDPEVAYGEEFKRELRQEIKKDDPVGAASAVGGGGAAVGGAVSALGGLAASAGSSSPSSGSSPSGVYDSPTSGDLAVPSGTHSDHKHLTAGNDVLRYASSPITWGIAIIIVLALFVFGILR